MGTRADFYVGRGPEAEWLGSIAWDGHPDSIDDALLQATSEADFRALLAAWLARRQDATLPSQGWPWPWNDSGTTDYAYAFDGGKVHGSGFGGAWFDPCENEWSDETAEKAVFPDMKERKTVAFGPRSGVIIVQGPA